MSQSKLAKVFTPTLPELPIELWSQILNTAWITKADLGAKRLVCKPFARLLRRGQLNQVFDELVHKRNSKSARRAQEDAQEDAQGHRALLESVREVGNARLYVFFKLLIHNMDPSARRELRIKGIEALRECNRWFDKEDLF